MGSPSSDRARTLQFAAAAILAALLLGSAPGCTSRPGTVQSKLLEFEDSFRPSLRLQPEAHLHIQRSDFKEAGRLLAIAGLLDPQNSRIRAGRREIRRILTRDDPEWNPECWWCGPGYKEATLRVELVERLADGRRLMQERRHVSARAQFRAAWSLRWHLSGHAAMEDLDENTRAFLDEASRLAEIASERALEEDSQ